MLFTLAVLLLFLWLIGMVSGLTLGAWIHLLLLVAVATIVINLFRSRA